MDIITDRAQWQALAVRLGMREDWHEPDEQCVTARVAGVTFDNAGFWPEGDGERFANYEQHVIISTYTDDDHHDGCDLATCQCQQYTDVAAVNLATLCAWAAERP